LVGRLHQLNTFERVEACEQVLDKYINKPEIHHNEQRAYYRSCDDLINMPVRESFDNSDHYYATLFHECVHSTGSKNRLNRDTVAGNVLFGSDTYSKEELIAEMGSSFLCAETHIDNKTFDNSVAYIKGWLAKLRNDPKVIVSASAQAQKAVNYMLNKEEGE